MNEISSNCIESHQSNSNIFDSEIPHFFRCEAEEVKTEEPLAEQEVEVAEEVETEEPVAEEKVEETEESSAENKEKNCHQRQPEDGKRPQKHKIPAQT